jgi:hypothetical protein
MSQTKIAIIDLKAAHLQNGGKPLRGKSEVNGISKLQARAALRDDIEPAMIELEQYRNGTHPDYSQDGESAPRPRTVSLKEFAKERWGIDCTGQNQSTNLYLALGINPSRTTIENLMTHAEASKFKFLVPEIFLEAIELSLKTEPVYSRIISTSQPVDNRTVNIPGIGGNNNIPQITQEGGTIHMGTLTFQNKTVTINKITQGFRLTDELKNTTINMLTLALQSTARNMGFKRDALAMKVLLNGEQADGSASAPIVGLDVANTLAFKDLGRVQTRMAMLGHSPNVVVVGEDACNDMRDLPEFKGFAGQTTSQTLKSNLPLLPTIEQIVTPFVPTDSIIYVNTMDCMIELVASPLKIESGREITTQSELITVSITVGYATKYRDARTIIDQTEDLTSAPFPDYMDVQAFAAMFE